MSKARSPREVCSTTIGTSGLISSAPCCRGSTVSLVSAGSSFSGVQIDSRASWSSGAIGLHLGRDAVERLLQANVVANTVCAALGDEGLDVLVALTRGAQLLADLVVA